MYDFINELKTSKMLIPIINDSKASLVKKELPISGSIMISKGVKMQ